MQFNRFAVASAAAALSLGAMAVVPAYAQDTTPTTSEPTATTTSFTMNCTSDPDISGFIGGPVTFGLDAEVTAPEFADQDASVDWSANYTLVVPAGLLTLASGAGITDIGVSDLNLNTHPSGGISGPDVAAAPTSFNIPVSSGQYTVTAAGTVTVDDAATPGYLSLVDPISLNVVVDLGGGNSFSVATSCTSGEADVAAINGTLRPTTTAAPATTTTTAAAAVKSTPRYTG